MALFIAGKDESCGPRTPPEIAPVSSTGKKPLGILIDQHHIERDGEEEYA